MAEAISSAAQLQGGGKVSDRREERLDTLEDPLRLCGRGRLYCAFLKVDDHCSVCRLDFTGQRADDLPAYLVIVIVGHVLVPVILWIEVDYAPSLAFQLGVYLPITALASIAFLQPVKGAVVALQWSLRMHGFGARPPDEFQS